MPARATPIGKLQDCLKKTQKTRAQRTLHRIRINQSWRRTPSLAMALLSVNGSANRGKTPEPRGERTPLEDDQGKRGIRRERGELNRAEPRTAEPQGSDHARQRVVAGTAPPLVQPRIAG